MSFCAGGNNFFDDRPLSYTDGDFESESLAAGGGVSGTDDFKTSDDDTDQFTDADTEKVKIVSVDAQGLVTKVTLTDQDGDTGTDEAHDKFEDLETLPTRNSAEVDHDTLNERAGVQDAYKEKGRIDITIDSPAASLNDQLHLTETLTLDDTTVAGDIESDNGTEDIVGQVSNLPDHSSDTEQDTFKDTSDVTDDLTVTVTLHATERIVANDGTITETSVDRGLKDHVQDEEKDTLTDQHNNHSGSSAGPIEDDDTFDDFFTDTETDSGADNFSVSVTGPVAHGTSYTWSAVGDEFTETDTETDDDNGEDDSDAPDDGPTTTSVNEADDEHDTETDDFQDEIRGDTYTMSGTNQTLTDPVTGVVTTIGTSDLVFDRFDDKEKDHFVDQHTQHGAGQAVPDGNGGTSSGTVGTTDDITAADSLQAEDNVISGDDLVITIVGHPSAGVTETFQATILVNGQVDYMESDSDKLAEDVNSASDSENETTRDIGGDSVYEVITIGDNTTITTIDPSTGLQTVNTFNDAGKIVLGEDDAVHSTDIYAGAGPLNPSGSGEDDIKTHANSENTINGTNTSTRTTIVSGILSDGSVVNSTDTRGSHLVEEGDTDDLQDVVATDLETNGHDTSETSQTTDKTSEDVQSSDTETNSFQSTVTMTDPVTGMTVTFSVSDQSGDTITDTEEAHGTDIATSSATNITSGVAPTPTTTDTSSGEDDVAVNDHATDHVTFSFTTQGTDQLGEQVFMQGTVDLNGMTDDGMTDDVTQAADGTDEEVDTETGGTTLIGSVTGTTIISYVDPNPGIKTTRTVIENNSGASGEQAQETEDTTQAASGNSAAGGGSESAQISDTWSETVITTQTNPDGSNAAPPVIVTDSGSDLTVLQTVIVVGADGKKTATVTATETGSDNSSDPAIGNSSWSGSQVDLGGLDIPYTVNGITVTPPGDVVNPAGGTPSGVPAGTGGITIITPGQVVNPVGTSTPHAKQEEDWLGSTFGGMSWIKRADQFAGQVNTLVWTGQWVDKSTASGLEVAKSVKKGAEVGAKAVINSAAHTVVSTATLGTYDGPDVITVTALDRDMGYEFSAGLSRAGLETLAGVATGGTVAVLSKGGKVARVVSTGLRVMDVAQNGVSIGTGAVDIAENELTWQNGLKVAGGFLGNAGALSGTKASITKANTAAATAADNATAIKRANAQLNILDNVRCFAPDTPVATPDGLRRIADIMVGDLVFAHHFKTGSWVPRPVTVRHENVYEGPVVTISTEAGDVRTTVYHPFWVLRGADLGERSIPRELSPKEDQGESLPGRWVNSHELRVGDLLYGQDGRERVLLRIQQEFRSAFPVNNLTIGDDHTFAVGSDALLVHNTSECDLAAKGKVTTPNAAARAKVQGEYTDPLTGKTVATPKLLAADHIFPKSEIQKLQGFEKLTKEQQAVILNHSDNFQGLPTTFNSSKRNNLNWSTYKGQPLDSTYAYELQQAQQQMREVLQKMIDDFLT